MTSTAEKTNLLGMSQDDLEQFLAARSEKSFRARQIMQWIYQRGIDDFDEMTDLSKALRERLNADAEIVPPKVQARHDSKFSSPRPTAARCAYRRRSAVHWTARFVQQALRVSTAI